MTMIDATNLTKYYGDVKAVRGIDLSVEAGSIHGFVGPNGAGKSTTMGMLVGVVTPTAGEATIGGEPAGSQAALERIGYAPQHPVFYESMTGRAYLTYVGSIAGVEGSLSDRVAELLDWLDIADAADQAIEGYSGGMKRRLGLAQAMIHDPEVLILDEPTAELDPTGRAAIIDALESLTDEGKTVFVSSHVLAELEQFVEAVTIIDDGRVLAAGSLEAVHDSVDDAFTVHSTDDETLRGALEGHRTVEAVHANPDGGLTVRVADRAGFATALPAMAAEAEVGLHELSRQSSLEAAFLELIDDDAAAARLADSDRPAGDDSQPAADGDRVGAADGNRVGAAESGVEATFRSDSAALSTGSSTDVEPGRESETEVR